jgi:hypothetical protein
MLDMGGVLMWTIVVGAQIFAVPAAFAQSFHPLGSISPMTMCQVFTRTALGRAFDYPIQQGRQVPGHLDVKPNAFGPDIGMDA